MDKLKANADKYNEKMINEKNKKIENYLDEKFKNDDWKGWGNYGAYDRHLYTHHEGYPDPRLKKYTCSDLEQFIIHMNQTKKYPVMLKYKEGCDYNCYIYANWNQG